MPWEVELLTKTKVGRIAYLEVHLEHSIPANYILALGIQQQPDIILTLVFAPPDFAFKTIDRGR
jgi:hypothetical protein